MPKANYSGVRTDEDTIDLLGRLAVHYSDDVIAGILNRQGRKTATGERFTAGHVATCAAIGVFPALKRRQHRHMATGQRS